MPVYGKCKIHGYETLDYMCPVCQRSQIDEQGNVLAALRRYLAAGDEYREAYRKQEVKKINILDGQLHESLTCLKAQLKKYDELRDAHRKKMKGDG